MPVQASENSKKSYYLRRIGVGQADESSSKIFRHRVPAQALAVVGLLTSGTQKSIYSDGFCVSPTRIVVDSGLFTARAARLPTKVVQAARQSGVRASRVQVRLGIGVGPLIVLRPLSPSAPPHILHQRSQAFMRGGDAAESWVVRPQSNTRAQVLAESKLSHHKMNCTHWYSKYHDRNDRQQRRIL